MLNVQYRQQLFVHPTYDQQEPTVGATTGARGVVAAPHAGAGTGPGLPGSATSGTDTPIVSSGQQSAEAEVLVQSSEAAGVGAPSSGARGDN